MKKVLIVITDGQSNDRGDLEGSAKSAESKKIVRFAIGVSCIVTPLIYHVLIKCMLLFKCLESPAPTRLILSDG